MPHVILAAAELRLPGSEPDSWADGQAKLNRDLRRASDVEFLDLAEGKTAEIDLANVP